MQRCPTCKQPILRNPNLDYEDVPRNVVKKTDDNDDDWEATQEKTWKELFPNHAGGKRRRKKAMNKRKSKKKNTRRLSKKKNTRRRIRKQKGGGFNPSEKNKLKIL